MSVRYKTVEKAACAEQTIEKSRFIAYVFPVSNKDEADAALASLRAKYRDATHCVPAYIIGEKRLEKWASDDGEPQGTSGAPMLQMMDQEGLTDLLVAVVRYFGGIKLGPGGLVRAYTSSAKMAIEAAGIHEAKDVVSMTVSIPYALYDKIRNLSEKLPFDIIKTDFTDRAALQLEFEPEFEAEMMSILQDMTSGNPDIKEVLRSIR